MCVEVIEQMTIPKGELAVQRFSVLFHLLNSKCTRLLTEVTVSFMRYSPLERITEVMDNPMTVDVLNEHVQAKFCEVTVEPREMI